MDERSRTAVEVMEEETRPRPSRFLRRPSHIRANDMEPGNIPPALTWLHQSRTIQDIPRVTSGKTLHSLGCPLSWTGGMGCNVDWRWRSLNFDAYLSTGMHSDPLATTATKAEASPMLPWRHHGVDQGRWLIPHSLSGYGHPDH